MKIFVTLLVIILHTLLSSWVLSEELKSHHPLIKKDSAVNSPDGVSEDINITANPKPLTQEGQPDIFFEEPIHNFGKIYKNEDVEHVFVFHNFGTKDLIIDEIKFSCGCLVSEETTRYLPPGMSGAIGIILRTGSYTGMMKNNITIYSNDPETPVYSLILSGEVIEDIMVIPRHIRFGYVSTGEERQAVVKLQSSPGFNLEVTDVISSNPDISIKYGKHEYENKYVVEAILNETAKVGVLKGNIRILTNSEKQRQVIIPFSGEVLGDIQLYPSHIYFGVIKKGREYARSAFLTLINENIEVKKIEVKPDFLFSEIIKEPEKDTDEERHEILRSSFWEVSTDLPENNITEKRHTLLRIMTRIKGNVQVGKLDGEIKLYTNSKIQPFIKIPVSAEIID